MIRVARTISKMIGFVVITATTCVLLCLPAWAGPSEYRTSLTRSSLENGFEKTSVAILKPDAGQGREVVAKQLLSKLNDGLSSRLVATDLKESQNDQRTLSYEGKNSFLDIYTDGTKFRFRGDIDNSRATSRKLANTELESLGRAFIEKNLSDFVKTDRENSITFLGTRYLRDRGTDLRSIVKDQVIANIAIFGREVNGIPVVGSGSKIALWFANDREPIAFDVDWPTYKPTGEEQEILPKDKLRTRVEAITIAPVKSSEAKVSRFECGYVDLGAVKRGSFIQSGCSVSYEGRSKPVNTAGETLKWARIEFVPAGAKILDDPQWPLANFIIKEGEPKPDNPESILLSAQKDPGNA